MRMGVAGIAGRMGRMLAAVVTESGFVLTGGTCLAGETPPDAPIFPDIAALAAASDAVIDFTHASTAQDHAAALATAGCIWVLGTTGLSPADQGAVNAAADRIAVVQAANFAPGVNLVLALAERLGAALPAADYDAEIVEMHHRQKVDAPSGTALALGRALATGRGVPFDSVRAAARDGNTGPRAAGEIGFAALRGGQIVGEHTLLLTAGDEQIALTHRAFDRASFARGAVRAAAWAAGKPPGLYTMMDVLGMKADR